MGKNLDFSTTIICYNIVVLRNWVLRQTVSLPVLTTACVYKTNYMVSTKDFSKDYQKPHELLRILQPYLDLNGLK